MISKIIAIQGDHFSKIDPNTDTSIFLAHEIQSKNYKIFYYEPEYLSVINSKVGAEGYFVKFNYRKKKFFKIQSYKIKTNFREINQWSQPLVSDHKKALNK